MSAGAMNECDLLGSILEVRAEVSIVVGLDGWQEVDV